MKRSLFMKPLLSMLSAVLMAVMLIAPVSATTQIGYLLEVDNNHHALMSSVSDKNLNTTKPGISKFSANKYKFDLASTYKAPLIKKVGLLAYNHTQKSIGYANRMRYAHNRNDSDNRYNRLRHSKLYG